MVLSLGDVNIGKAIESQMTSLRRRRHHVDKQSKIGTQKNLKAEEKMKARMKRADASNVTKVEVKTEKAGTSRDVERKKSTGDSKANNSRTGDKAT